MSIILWAKLLTDPTKIRHLFRKQNTLKIKVVKNVRNKSCFCQILLKEHPFQRDSTNL